MPKFNCFSAVTVTAITVVEAADAVEALAIAEQRGTVVMGGNGSGADINTEWVIEEADGEPDEIRVEQ